MLKHAIPVGQGNANVIPRVLHARCVCQATWSVLGQKSTSGGPSRGWPLARLGLTKEGLEERKRFVSRREKSGMMKTRMKALMEMLKVLATNKTNRTKFLVATTIAQIKRSGIKKCPEPTRLLLPPVTLLQCLGSICFNRSVTRLVGSLHSLRMSEHLP